MIEVVGNTEKKGSDKKKGEGDWTVDVAFRPRAPFDLPSETNCRLPTSHRLPSAASALAL